MDTLVDEAEASIARRVRLERNARNWSLAELAERSGVAKASISKIERGEVSPSAGHPGADRRSFRPEPCGASGARRRTGRLFRLADQPQWRDPRTGYTRRQIFRNPSHPLEVVEIEMPPGKKASFPASTYVNLKHVVWIEEGELVLTESDERNVLKAGDSLGFGPPSEVTYANESRKPCRYIVVLMRN